MTVTTRPMAGITATVTGGTGYTVHSQSNADSVTVNDDDVVAPAIRVTSQQSAHATDYEGHDADLHAAR